MSHISPNMYNFCYIDEASAIRKRNIKMTSITGSQIIFFVALLFFSHNQTKTRKQVYRSHH